MLPFVSLSAPTTSPQTQEVTMKDLFLFLFLFYVCMRVLFFVIVFIFLFINIIKDFFFFWHYPEASMNYQTSDFIVVSEKLRVYGCWVLLNWFYHVK